MAEDQDDSQKTEDPTHKRLEDAVKQGSVPFSREVTSFLMLLVFAFIIIWISPFMMEKTLHSLVHFISDPHLISLDSNTGISIAKGLLYNMLAILAVPVLILMIVIIISALLQHGFVMSFETIMPKFDRISPLSGFKRIFSMRSIVEFIKGLLKMIIIGVVAFIAVYPKLHELGKLADASLLATLFFMSKLAARMMVGVCVAMFLIAVIDFLYQRFEYLKSMRMSKRDIKDEFKQTEGSPEVKAKLRELRAKRAGRRMMQDVPTADVVITNPTHYSIALQYEMQKTDAPVIVAKGKDLIALRIREIAKENNVPLVENPPLARALFNSTEIGDEIPIEHYNAVAEVIRYVYKLKGKMPKKKA